MTRKNSNTDMQTFDVYQEDSPKTKSSENLAKKKRPNPDDFVRKGSRSSSSKVSRVSSHHKKEDAGSLVKGILLGLLIATAFILFDYFV